jgi:hypothetical protein
LNVRRILSGMIVVLAADLVAGLITGGPGLAGLLARVVLLGSVAVVRLGVLGPRTPERTAWLSLSLLLLPAAVQLHVAGGRINGDGVMYYVYTLSLMKDGDLDFTNEYAHYELVDRADLSMLTDTGRRRSIFAVGPGLAATPFFALGELVARGHRAAGADVDLSGYGPHHVNAVALGSLLYGFLTLALIHSLLRRHFETPIAVGATLLVWGATFLHWYMVQQPMMAHASSAFGAALLVWLWDRDRGRRTVSGFLAIGILGGLAMCLRWQNGVLLVLPALELAERVFKKELPWPRMTASAALMGAGALLGAIPQMWAWKYIYGEYLLPHPPHGADFLRLGHPYLLQTLFSSRHGLLSWTPVFWLGFLGFVPLLKNRPRLALPLLLPLVLMTYVNACSGDWWAGASFSNRRFDSQLSILAVGFAASLDLLRRGLMQQPAIVPVVLAGLFIAGRLDLGARVAERLGSPTTWPASWVFALAHGRPPGQYDRLVGRYLFYRQNNMKGRIDLGLPGDDVMLGEGWGTPESHGGVVGRPVLGSARMFAPLDVPEDLGLRVRTSAHAEGVGVVVRVNGREVGRFAAPLAWNEHELIVPAGMWRRELNEVAVDAASPGVCVDQVNFIREPR